MKSNWSKGTLIGISLLSQALLVISVPNPAFAGGLSKDSKIRFFGSLGYGPSLLNSDQVSGSSGTQLQLGGTASLYQDHWVMDLGAGWARNSMTGSFANRISSNIETKSAFVDLGGRYRLGSRWQFGPELQFEFGTPLGFDAQSTVGSPSSLLLVGAKAAYEMEVGQSALRFLIEPLTDISLPGSRRIYIFMAGIEASLPFMQVSLAPRAEPTPAPTPPPAPRNEVRYEIPLNAVHFKSNSSKLNEGSRASLKRECARKATLEFSIRVK